MFSIYHSRNTRDTTFFGHDEICSRADIMELIANNGYDFVADIDATNLNEAFHLTNSIDTAWTSNTVAILKLDEKFMKGARSTSVGDIIKDDNDKMWIVASFGFEPLNKEES